MPNLKKTLGSTVLDPKFFFSDPNLDPALALISDSDPQHCSEKYNILPSLALIMTGKPISSALAMPSSTLATQPLLFTQTIISQSYQ
jgi:hypothetical protein